MKRRCQTCKHASSLTDVGSLATRLRLALRIRVERIKAAPSREIQEHCNRLQIMQSFRSAFIKLAIIRLGPRSCLFHVYFIRNAQKQEKHTHNDTLRHGYKIFILPRLVTVIIWTSWLVFCPHLSLLPRWWCVSGQAEWDRGLEKRVLVQHVALLVGVRFSVEAPEFGVGGDEIVDQDTTGVVLVINYQGRWIAVVTSVL